MEAPFAVKFAVAPSQIVGEFTVITGSGFTVTVAIAVLLQLLTSVPVTVYDVVLVGVTVMGFIVAPVLQEYVEAPMPVKVALAPLQIEAEFTVIIGKGFTVTVATAVPVQPATSVPVTV